MRNLKAALIFILIPCVFALGTVGCERNKKSLGNIEPEENSPEYKFTPDNNLPPGGIERP
jgi:hypothetical protein